MKQFVFIVGSPRSGTTILEHVLSSHNDIQDWYEPYYIWEDAFRCDDTDIWNVDDLTEENIAKVRREFEIFYQKAKKPVIIDKTPPHAFNIKSIHTVFPDAKFIHMIRHGGDVTLSIKKEWQKRKAMVQKKDVSALWFVFKRMMSYQPYWRFRLKAIWFELKSRANILRPNIFNKARWKNFFGWGPRFTGWEEYLQTHQEIEFNAMQWVKSVEAAQKDWKSVPKKNRLEVKYEDLLKKPEATLKEIMDFIGLDMPVDFSERMPKLKTDNLNKWKKELSKEEVKLVEPIITPMLKKLGYK